MAEMIFILLTAYVAYVVYSASSSDKKNQAVSVKPKSQTPEVNVVAKKAEKTTVKKKVVEKKIIEKAVKPVAKKAATVAKVATATKMPGGSLRNPETGEVAKMANSYQMCKRWIKEALVSEGFLDKIYKSSEIDDAARGEINQALEKLMEMETYAT